MFRFLSNTLVGYQQSRDSLAEDSNCVEEVRSASALPYSLVYVLLPLLPLLPYEIRLICIYI